MKNKKENNYVENLQKMMSDWTSQRDEIAKNIADIEERYRKRIEEEKKLLDIELKTYDLRIEKLNAVLESFDETETLAAEMPAIPEEAVPTPDPESVSVSEPEPENPIQDTVYPENNETEEPEPPVEAETSDFAEFTDGPAEEPESNDSDWPDTVEEWN